MLPYFETIRALLDRAEAQNAATIRVCGEVIAASLAKGGVLHTFGTGHSHLLAEELFHRAGGLAAINPLLDPRLMLHEGTMAATLTERLPGYAEAVLSRYSLQAGEVMIVASNSGRNAVPVEMALGAQARGLRVIALTSVAHSASQSPRHASGKRLFEIADYVLDNCGETGDAALSLDGVDGRLCATSTVIGAALLQALAYAVAENLLTLGVEPAVLNSSNTGSGEADVRNQQYIDRYKGRITHT
jgi:uncharacterized phosphosugar-binding protein